jgi:azurin
MKLFSFVFLGLVASVFGESNVAKPKEHSYADPAGGRVGYALAGEMVNEVRLYDFYQRQADFYMAAAAGEVPEILPAYPGLDAGLHGHWGKHNQNNHEDGRWNDIEIGSLLTQVVRKEKFSVLKGICVKLGDDVTACFDPQRLVYRAVWQGGFVKFNPFRWGTSRNAEPVGKFLFQDNESTVDGAYLGFYRNGEQVIFHYRVAGEEIFESPAFKDGEFVKVRLEGFEPGGLAWPETVETKVVLGEARGDSAYATDTLTVPYANPFNSVMQLSGIAFDTAGVAYVTTLAGEVWSVRGFDGDTLTWKRFASGLNQPVGIRIDADGMFVLDRGQIYRLHDLNRDGEADYYENYANDFGGYDRSHSHTFGLHRTGDGAFHFTQRESVLRTGTDRKTVQQGWGVRNCMGIGGSKDYFWVAPQEGTWTPASSIIEVNNGEFYGLPQGGKAGTIAAPLCFIPRGVENSVGGMLEVTSDLWGPFKGQHVGLSYGSGLHYLVLRDADGARPQGAVVPMEGEFLAGTIRGAFHPKDGQLYVAGLDGWGDYSVKDGCLHRVRYVGKPVYKPSGFRVHSNGVRIDLTAAVTQPEVKEFFAHVWNYEYANRYGSPEFSVKNPKSLGHDGVEIRSVVLLNEGKSIFVEMPDLEPVMQLHVRMHLTAVDGHAFKTDLFASPMYPSGPFKTEGLAAPVGGKLTAVTLRVAANETEAEPMSGEVIEGARGLLVEVAGGLQYTQKKLRAKAGEALALTLKNADVMPHNLVIVQPGTTKKVGDASFAMLNDPEAGKKSYVPDLAEVIVFVPVLNPGKEHVLNFRAPEKAGEYPYICTFPGHWQAMRGVLVVE